MRYIHYGNSEFSTETLLCKHEECKYHREDKPAGLWASPEGAAYSWREWCEMWEYKLERLNTHFSFALKPSARVLHIHHLADVEPYICIMEEGGLRLNLDKIYSMFDAMEFHRDTCENTMCHPIFGSWDVDSICIWNPEVVNVLHGFHVRKMRA